MDSNRYCRFCSCRCFRILQKRLAGKDFEGAAKNTYRQFRRFCCRGSKKEQLQVLAEALTGAEGAIELANRVFGQADNPFVEVFFNTMNVRTFTYNFNFAPRNESETEEIQQIIQLFRFHMAPELKGQNNRFLTLPSEFDIHYMYQSKRWSTNVKMITLIELQPVY